MTVPLVLPQNMKYGQKSYVQKEHILLETRIDFLCSRFSIENSSYQNDNVFRVSS